MKNKVTQQKPSLETEAWIMFFFVLSLNVFFSFVVLTNCENGATQRSFVVSTVFLFLHHSLLFLTLSRRTTVKLIIEFCTILTNVESVLTLSYVKY